MLEARTLPQEAGWPQLTRYRPIQYAPDIPDHNLLHPDKK